MNSHVFQKNIKESESNKLINYFLLKAMCNFFKVDKNSIKKVAYKNKGRMLQKSGVDYIVKRKDKTFFVETKVRFRFPKNYNFDDIGWEIKHTYDIEGFDIKEKGWGDSENILTHYLLYLYWPKDNDNKKRLLVIDYKKTRYYWWYNIKGSSKENLLRSYTKKNEEGKILYYTFSHYLKKEEISNFIDREYKIVNSKNIRRLVK